MVLIYIGLYIIGCIFAYICMFSFVYNTFTPPYYPIKQRYKDTLEDMNFYASLCVFSWILVAGYLLYLTIKVVFRIINLLILTILVLINKRSED